MYWTPDGLMLQNYTKVHCRMNIVWIVDVNPTANRFSLMSGENSISCN